MNSLKFSLLFMFSFFLYKFFHRTLINLCEINTCPYCFGKDLCGDFMTANVHIASNSILELITNYLSVKNVFYGVYKNETVVFKKLGHSFELNELDVTILKEVNIEPGALSFDKIITLARSRNNLKICSSKAAITFLNLLLERSTGDSDIYMYIWTILHINAEPLIIQLLKAEDDWPVPRYLGACGRLIVESHCGANLNSFASSDWHIRSKLALQLLQAVKNFTERHADFRFYLTDISPDNIAVGDDLKLSFVDLENVIVTEKSNSVGTVHFSNTFEEDGFAFSEDEVCESSISDHNYYAICKLLLSKKAPWPMMEGGLLHTPPDDIVERHFRLFTLIESCAHKVTQINCFEAAEELILILQNL